MTEQPLMCLAHKVPLPCRDCGGPLFFPSEDSPRVMEAEDIGLTPCMEGDHDYEVIDDSFDHELGTEQIFYRRCKDCGHEAEYNPPDDYGDY